MQENKLYKRYYIEKERTSSFVINENCNRILATGKKIMKEM
jgi:hypothetical protein